MPAVSRQRPGRHTQTPYVRQKRSSKLVDDEVTLKTTESTGLLAGAASRFLHLINWALSSADDLSDKARSSASKIVRRDPPQRSNTSQMEDGVLGKAATRSSSLLSADLVPHYLGKTPRALRVRSQQGIDASKTTFELPMFDSTRFKIPALPTPQQEERMIPMQDLRTLGPNQRGKNLKALEISNVTQTRHDNEILGWLASQNLQPKDLITHKSLDELRIEDPDKLRKILRDDGFFRRRGLKPPTESRESSQSQVNRTEPHKERFAHSVRSLDHSQSERSASTLRGQTINPRNWQTHSSTGILSAWRDICENQEARTQAQSLSLPEHRERSKSRTTSFASSQREPETWHSNFSYTNEPSVEEQKGQTEPRAQIAQVDDKYWGTVRAFPVPPKDAKSPSTLKHDHIPQQPIQRHKRSHSRQLSLARRPQRASDYAAARSPRVSRQATPNSVKSSRHSSRKPNTSSDGNNQEVESRTNKLVEKDKPVMVDSQVQTIDTVTPTPVRPTEYVAASEEHRVISKERRKRPGCFSALDEDMEDIFGPYSDIPSKKARMHDDVAELAYPRVPLLREDEEVKAFRARQTDKEVKTSGGGGVKDIPTHDTMSILEPSTLGRTSTDLQHSDTVAQDNTGSLNTSNRIPSEARPSASLGASAVPPFVFGATAAKPIAASVSQLQTDGLLAGESKIPKFDFNPAASTEAFRANAEPQSKSLSTPQVFSFGDSGTSTKGQSMDREAPKRDSQLAQTSTGFKFGTADTGKDMSAAGFTFSSVNPRESGANNKVAVKDKVALDTTDAGQTFASANSTSVPLKFSFGQPAVAQAPTNVRTLGSPAPGSSPGMSFQFGMQQPKEIEKNSSIGLTNTVAIPEVTIEPLDTQAKASTASSKPQFASGNQKQEQTTLDTPKATSSGFKFGATVIPSTSSGFTFDKNTDRNTDKEATRFVFGSTSPSVKSLELTSAPTLPAVKDTGSKSNADTGVSTTFGGFGGFGNIGKSEIEPHQALPANAATTATSTVPKFNFAEPGTTSNQAPSENTALNTTSSVPSFSFGGSSITTSNNNAFGASTTPTVSSSSLSMPSSTGPPQSTSMFGQPVSSTFSQNTNNGTTGNIAGSGFNFSTSSSAPAGSFGSTIANKPESSFNAPTVVPATLPFGATSTSAPTTLFGANSAGQSTAFNFGAPSGTSASSANPAPFAFGAPAASSSMFGAPHNSMAPSFGTQNNAQVPQAQTFVFGSQVNTAPSSGFASPAVHSPSLQSATVPGSPNPFDFNAGAQAQGQAGAGAGSRKIAQPRSRRARGGGSNR